MKVRFHSVLAFAALALCASFGCNSNPTSPSADFADPSSQGGVAGATLNGTFQASGSAFRASRAAGEDGLNVIVLDSRGDDIARVDVVNGRFTLRGLPDAFTLVFIDGNDEVGRESFDGVKINQELDVLLSYDGSSVEVVEVKRTGIDHQPGDGIEVEGTVTELGGPTTEFSGTLDRTPSESERLKPRSGKATEAYPSKS